MFVKAKYNDIDMYKRDVQQDLFIPFNTVHDEIDYLIDSNMFKPLLKKIINISALKKVMGKLKLPYINILFDVEYDEYNSWTAKKDIDIYQVALHEEEHKWRKKYQDLYSKLSQKRSDTNKKEPLKSSSKENQVSSNIIELVLPEKEMTEELLEKIQKSSEGNIRLGVNVNGDIMWYSKLINEKVVKEYL